MFLPLLVLALIHFFWIGLIYVMSRHIYHIDANEDNHHSRMIWSVFPLINILAAFLIFLSFISRYAGPVSENPIYKLRMKRNSTDGTDKRYTREELYTLYFNDCNSRINQCKLALANIVMYHGASLKSNRDLLMQFTVIEDSVKSVARRLKSEVNIHDLIGADRILKEHIAQLNDLTVVCGTNTV